MATRALSNFFLGAHCFVTAGYLRNSHYLSRAMPVYWVAIEVDGASEFSVEAKDLSEAVEIGKREALEALYRGLDLWVVRANEPGKAPGYLSEGTRIKWRPVDDI